MGIDSQRGTSVMLMMEYRLAGVLEYSEVVSGRVEVVQLPGGKAQRNVNCPIIAGIPYARRCPAFVGSGSSA